MKKIIIGIALSLFTFTTASAELGVNVGISAATGLFGATGKEVQTDADGTEGTQTQKRSEIMQASFGSIFIEKSFGDRFAIGIDIVPASLETEATEVRRTHITTAYQEVSTSVENKIQVDFEELMHVYLSMNITDNAFVKVGTGSVDVITNENMGTGAVYGNTSMDLIVYGVGYTNSFDNGAFIRVEGQYMDFDGASLVSGDNTISVSGVDGLTGKLSIGKSF